jgi:class 3 adenylate cyclase
VPTMLEDLGNLELRGLRRPVAAFSVVQSTGSSQFDRRREGAGGLILDNAKVS